MTRRCGSCAVVPTLLCALYRLRARPSRSSTRIPSSPYAANYLYMMLGAVPTRRARPRGRAVPHLDHRPRVQRIDVHRPGHHLHRRRPRPQRSSARSARCRGRCTAARRAVRCRCSTRSAPIDHADALDPRRGRARRPPHGLRTPRLQDRRPALRHAAQRRRAARRPQARARRARRAARPSRSSPS